MCRLWNFWLEGAQAVGRKWNGGVFVKKWTFSPQNETKLMPDLFVILLTHTTYPLPAGLGLPIILSQKFNHVILLFECYMPVGYWICLDQFILFFATLQKSPSAWLVVYASVYGVYFSWFVIIDLVIVLFDFMILWRLVVVTSFDSTSIPDILCSCHAMHAIDKLAVLWTTVTTRVRFSKHLTNGTRLFLGTIHLQNREIIWDGVCELANDIR